MKYHVNGKGEARPCSATIGHCHFGTSDEHYSTPEEAREAFERWMDASIVSPMSRSENTDRDSDIENIVTTGNTDITENHVDSIDDETIENSENEDTSQARQSAFLDAREKYEKQSWDYVNSLTQQERDAVEAYVNQDYSDINSELWNGDSSHELIPALDSALSKAPGGERTLYRKPVVRGKREEVESWLDTFSPGSTVDLNGYTSTSEGRDAMVPLLVRKPRLGIFVDAEAAAKMDTTYKNVVFEIISDKGAPVSVLSHMPQESEWLLPRGGKFEVVEVERDATVSSDVYLVTGETREIVEERSATVVRLKHIQ